MQTNSDECLRATLDALERKVSADSNTFRDAAKTFEVELGESMGLTREQRAELWQSYQAVWDARKALVAERQSRSEAAKRAYQNELESLDYSHDGLPILQDFSNWARVGDKVRTSRARVIGIQARIKGDGNLLPPDRRELRDAIDTIWDKIRQSEEVTFSVHRERAERL